MKVIFWITATIATVTLLYVGLWQNSSDTTATDTAQQSLIGGEFSLTDQFGNKVTNNSFKGKAMLVFFGFTNCPMICPTGLASMNQAIDLMGDEAPAGVFITVDPERDTVQQLHLYMENFPHITGLTGSKEQIKQAIKAYRVYAQKMAADSDSSGDNYEVNHSSYIYLMDKDGHYVTHLPHTATAEEIITTIRKSI